MGSTVGKHLPVDRRVTRLQAQFRGGERPATQRVPKGFSEDDPAAEYLKLRQFLAGTERPAEFATRPRFYGSLVRLFQQLIPFVRFLNEPLTDRRTRNTDLLSSG